MCVLVTTLFHIYILLFAFEGHVFIMGKTKHGSLKALVGQDRGGRGILGSKAKCVKYMWRSEHSEAETREALVDLRVNRQRRFNLMRDHFHALPEGARKPTPSNERLVTMGSLKINGFIPWSCVPVPLPTIHHPPCHCDVLFYYYYFGELANVHANTPTRGTAFRNMSMTQGRVSTCCSCSLVIVIPFKQLRAFRLAMS